VPDGPLVIPLVEGCPNLLPVGAGWKTESACIIPLALGVVACGEGWS